MWMFSALAACLAAGYGVLFTIVGDYRDAYGISETAVGLIIGLGFLSAFVAQVLIAPVADRGRARAVVFAGVAVNVAGLLLMAFGTSFGPIAFGRVISGIGIGAASPAIRRIVILAEPHRLGHNLGRLLSAEVFGFATGPAISAALVGPMGLEAPFVVVAGATVLTLALTAGVRVEDRGEVSRQRFAVDLLHQRHVAAAVILGAAAFLMIGAFDALWDVVHEDLGTDTWLANLGITLFAIPLIVLGPVGGRLAQRIGPYLFASVGLTIGAVFMTSYGLLPSGGWIFTFAMVHAVSDGLTIAASGVAVGMTVPEERQAGAQGLIGAAQALFAGITAIVVGGLYDGFGRTVAYSVAAVGMIVCVVVALALAAPTLRALRRQRRAARDSMAAGPRQRRVSAPSAGRARSR